MSQPISVQTALQDHQKWLSSEEKEGKRADLQGADLRGVDLSNADLRGAIMRGCLLDSANLSGAQLVHADLREAQLCEANLCRANLLLTDFTGADLTNADLSQTSRLNDQLGHIRRGPRFTDANLASADLHDAVCLMTDFTGANLSQANFSGASLRGAIFRDADLQALNFAGANLTQANLRDAKLAHAHLTHGDLSEADLQGADLSFADVRGADLRSANLGDAKVEGIIYNRVTQFRGIRANDCFGSSRFRRFAQDQDFIEEFKEAHPAVHFLWALITDCGRSMSRVVLLSVAFICLFSLIFFSLGQDAFSVTNLERLGWSLFTTTYYSVVTFTTLGFGDITPATPMAALMVMIEVVVGYVMLGILISILATKVARRS
ncbi:MAG: hypothetical protein ACI9ON_003361 [Limisphaerales bacterium]|jgi:uncharacterized protein YjbI with pentapeptide repeats